MQNENYVEVLSGIEDGQKVLVMLPKNTSGTNQNMKQGGFGGQGGQRNSGGSSNNKTQNSSNTKSNKN